MTGGVVALCTVVFVAPLAVGSVHRPAIWLATGLATLALCFFLAAEALIGRSLRLTGVVMLPLALLSVPLLQILPVPSPVAKRLDPVGDALLVESPVYASPFRPLSLDPPETRAVVGKMGAVLAIFVLAFHLASGRSRRQLLLRVVAASVVTAFVIGLGHRILDEDKIYGSFTGSRGLLNGPFINSNHLAEFMELGVFVCVACALAGASALNRVGWLSAAALLGAGALGTLSRGAVLGLGAGTLLFVFLRKTAPGDRAQIEPRRSMFWIGLMLLFLAVITLSLGADQFLTRISTTRVSQELRLQLWRDSLQVLRAHPFGIGRGAFERVFPAYRTVEAGIPVRFSFIENEPLQYLVEMGWVGFAAVVAALVFVVREGLRTRRRDAIETALASALVAVLVHNLVDFGLETLGILIPFAAVLGTLLGRTRNVEDRVWSRPRVTAVCAGAIIAIGIGAVSSTQASAADFDAQLGKAGTPQARHQIALLAQEAHPVDYLYVLAQAYAEPVAPPGAGASSPRLHALNHALLLCPRCPEVHVAVARTLWTLGRHAQALGEWRAAIKTRGSLFETSLEEVWTLQGRPDELALLPESDPERLVATISFLAEKNQRPYARKLLPLAIDAGAPPFDILLLGAKLDIDDGLTDEGLKKLAAAQKLRPQDAGAFLLQGEANLHAGAVDKALQALDLGIGMNPDDLPLQRKRLQVIMEHQKWHLAEQAMAGLETALHQAQQPTVELHLAAARFHAALRNYNKAGSEYNLALMQDHDNVAVWTELARLWESAGREGPALEAYREAHMIAPADPTTFAAIERIENHRRQLRLEVPAP